MARPRRDGKPSREKRKHKLTSLFVEKAKPEEHGYLVWDTLQKGFVLSVRPTGYKAFKCVYAFHRRVRWYHIADATAIGLADARALAAEVMLQRIKGSDPQAEKKKAKVEEMSERSKGTFQELAKLYLEEHAKKKNKSWRQPDALVTKHLLPRWGKLRAVDITKDDVKTTIAKIEAPVVANQTLAAASAIFTWAIDEEIFGIKDNPCRRVKRNKVESRERVLLESEIPKFWAAFDKAGLPGNVLKTILLTGQRPGEVMRMRREHLADGWWQMPGKPVKELGWPGTKNGESHRVWLSAAVQALINIDDGEGLVFGTKRGNPIPHPSHVMRAICAELGITDKVTPHDLRRTHGTTVTGLGFGRDAMNRIQNHKEGGIGSVYDRHGYAEENKRVMEAVAARIMSLVEGKPSDNVIVMRRQGSD